MRQHKRTNLLETYLAVGTFRNYFMEQAPEIQNPIPQNRLSYYQMYMYNYGMNFVLLTYFETKSH